MEKNHLNTRNSRREVLSPKWGKEKIKRTATAIAITLGALTAGQVLHSVINGDSENDKTPSPTPVTDVYRHYRPSANLPPATPDLNTVSSNYSPNVPKPTTTGELNTISMEPEAENIIITPQDHESPDTITFDLKG